MPVIDSDAHVLETEQTWEYTLPEDAAYKPQIVTRGDGKRFWLVDGQVKGEVRGMVAAKGLAESVTRNMVTDSAKRFMDDIAGRVAHMDELEIDVQVLYPSMYIQRWCDTPQSEMAMSRAYNRWLAHIWEEGKGRLRWTCILPLSNMDEAIKEARWAKEHGACGITIRPIEGERLLVDEYYDPLYREAVALNMPIAVHIGNSNPMFPRLMAADKAGGTFATFRLTSVAAAHAIISNDIVQKHPKLRFGIIEASSQWVPYVVHDLRRRLNTRGRTLAAEPFKNHNIWVTCQTDDDIPYVLKYAGASQLLIGTDYGHQDQSSEIEALRNIRKSGDVDPAIVDRILGENAITFYGL
ncbi:MAG: amidohydrolase family protein [Chloroflexota bacterium]